MCLNYGMPVSEVNDLGCGKVRFLSPPSAEWTFELQVTSKLGLSNNFLIAALNFLNCALIMLMYILKYRDSLRWAVQKWLNRLRCSLECWVEWVQGTWQCRCPCGKGHFWGISLIEKHRFGSWVKGQAVQKTGGPILMIYTLYDVFLFKQLSFGEHSYCTCIQIFSGVNCFLIAINSLMRSLLC